MNNKNFPVTNFCGQLFNDALANSHILEKYTCLGDISYPYQGLTEITIRKTGDIISILMNDKQIQSVEFETQDCKIIEEMSEYIQRNFIKVYSSLGREQFEYGKSSGNTAVFIYITGQFTTKRRFQIQFLD